MLMPFSLFSYITFLDECTCYRDRCSEDWAQKTQIFDRTLTRKLRLRLWLRADNKTGQLADCDITKSNYRIIRKKRRPQPRPPSTQGIDLPPPADSSHSGCHRTILTCCSSYPGDI